MLFGMFSSAKDFRLFLSNLKNLRKIGDVRNFTIHCYGWHTRESFEVNLMNRVLSRNQHVEDRASQLLGNLDDRLFKRQAPLDLFMGKLNQVRVLFRLINQDSRGLTQRSLFYTDLKNMLKLIRNFKIINI